MPETLLSPSNVLLYGRAVTDLQIVHPAPNHQPSGARGTSNQLLESQLSDPNATLARIYAFSYEGHYYDLAKPALFLVHGAGTPAQPAPGGPPQTPQTADLTGVATEDYNYSDDMRVWSYDKGDFSIRLDVMTGPLDQILLDFELDADQTPSYFGGANVGARGANVQTRGANIRGANVRGANVRTPGRGSSD
jgi:hypothetical protein